MNRLTLAALLLACATTATADMKKGMEAYDKGDYAAALSELRGPAEGGDATAQRTLGDMYTLAQGVAMDYAQALAWYRKAADHGDAEAQIMLGMFYDEGHGVEKNATEALGWYRRAAEQGNPDAQYRLGAMYATGNGVAQDEAQAYAWLTVANLRGNHLAKAARDAIGERLSPEQQKRADTLAIELSHEYGKHY